MLSRNFRGAVPDMGGVLDAAPDPGRARWSLAERASRALFGKTGLPAAGSPPAGTRVVRLATPVGTVNPLRWLRAQRGPKLYWSGRDDGLAVAAAGVADLLEGEAPGDVAALRKLPDLLPVSGSPRPRYYGGLRFDPAREPGEGWTGFGAYRFVLPRFELHASSSPSGGPSGASTLVCNLVLPHDAERAPEILDDIERLPSPPEAGFEAVLPAPLSRTDSPAFEGWKRNVERALSAFRKGRLGKVVLACKTGYRFGEDLDPLLLMEGLEAVTPGCFHFYVEPEEGVAFIGAPPERLYRREGRRVLSEAVAGTRPRGGPSWTDKHRSEHAYVRESIRGSLGGLCEEIEVDEWTSEMKLARVSHLVSGVRGTLREGVTDADVLRALHPTPAVGGHPKEEALDFIREQEPFDRGLYAGPVGWIGAGEAEFAVGIRSGLVRGRALDLFCGNGIVPGSTPEGEWAEIEHKIGSFMRAFGLEPGHAAR